MKAPAKIDGAEILQYLIIDSSHKFTEQTKHYKKGELIKPMYALAICTYNEEEGFYLFGCNDEWESITDTFHDTVKDAMHQAEFEYSGTTNSWIKVN